MDWSLVLASQGIAATIAHDSETGRWSLVVDGPDSQRALATLKRHHLENRGWHWEQPLPWTGMIFHWGGAAWCLFLAAVHGLVTHGAVELRQRGIMDEEAFSTGEWWRAFTAMSLHGDGVHLASNTVTGFILFGLVMARFGAGLGLLAAWLAGAGGYLFGLLIYAEPYRALGASGMVTGALGLLAAESVTHWRRDPASTKRAFAALAAGTMLFLLIGSDPASDLMAHLGGFVSGCALGALLGRVSREKLDRRPIRLGALAAFVAAVLATWSLALTRN